MASVALQTAGTAFGGPVLGVVGGIVGGIIDQAVIGELFPQDPIQGPRIDDQGIQSQSGGSPLTKCLGPECKTTGVITWTSKLREVERSDEIGKGATGPETLTYEYFRSIEVMIDVRRADQGPIDGFEEIWLDGDRVWVESPNVSVTPNASELTVSSIFVSLTGGVAAYHLRVESTDINADLSQFRTGKTATMSGWGNVGNNVAGMVRARGRNATTGVSFVVIQIGGASAPAPVDEGPIAGVTITQVLPNFDPTVVGNIRTYTGQAVQVPDPAMVSAEGIGEVPNGNYQVKVVLEDLNVTGSGGRPPQVTVKLRERATLNLQEAIEETIKEATVRNVEGLPTGDVTADASACAGINVRGSTISGRHSTADRLEVLRLAYDFLEQDDNGTLRFFPRQSASMDTVALSEAELGYSTRRRGAPDPVEFDDAIPSQEPQGLRVAFADARNEYQRDSGPYVRRGGVVDLVQDVNLTALVMNKEDAVCIGKRVTWQRVGARSGIKTQLPPSRLALLENDEIEFTSFGLSHVGLVSSITEGESGVLEVRGNSEARAPRELTAATDCVAETVPPVDQEAYVPPLMDLAVLQLPPLQAAQEATYGVYTAMVVADDDSAFLGASLYQSADGGSTYSLVAATDTQATMGRLTVALATDPSPETLSRGVFTLTVDLTNGTFETVTEDQMLAGANRIAVGNQADGFEVIGWTDSAQNPDGTWELSGSVLRGALGTDHLVGIHTASDVVVSLTRPGVTFQDLGLSSFFNTTRWFLALPSGAVFSDFDAQVAAESLGGATLKPLSPYRIEGARSAAGTTLAITWSRRTRAVWDGLNAVPPLLESQAIFDIEILDGPGGNIVGTLSGIVGESQNIDPTGFGYAAFAPVTVRIYQLGDSVGRGTPREATI